MNHTGFIGRKDFFVMIYSKILERNMFCITQLTTMSKQVKWTCKGLIKSIGQKGSYEQIGKIMFLTNDS